MLIKSTRFPELDVADLGVSFREGVAEVSAEQLEALKPLARDFGLEFPEEEFAPPPADSQPPTDEQSQKDEASATPPAAVEAATVDDAVPAKPKKGKGGSV